MAKKCLVDYCGAGASKKRSLSARIKTKGGVSDKSTHLSSSDMKWKRNGRGAARPRLLLLPGVESDFTYRLMKYPEAMRNE